MPPITSGQEIVVWGRNASPRISGRSLWGHGEPCRENAVLSGPSSTTSHCCTTAGMSIVPLVPTCTEFGSMACAAQPILLAHSDSPTWLCDSVHHVTPQIQRHPRDFSGSPRRPCPARGDCCPIGEGHTRDCPSSQDEVGVLQPLLHHAQERQRPSTNSGSASFESGPFQAPIQDAYAEARHQMHPAPGLVCSGRPEGRVPSCLYPSMPQTVPTVCVRGSGMAVQGPPLRAVPVPLFLYEGRRGRPCPIMGSGHQDLDDWLSMAQSREQLCDHWDLVLRHLSQSGLRVNWEKSKRSPVQRTSFLSMELGSVSMTARLTSERAQSILNCLSSFRGRTVVPLKHFQRLLGHMASTAAVTPLGLLHMRPLQHWLHSRAPRWAWCRGTVRVTITPTCAAHSAPGRTLSFYGPECPWHVVVTMDASSAGWFLGLFTLMHREWLNMQIH